MGSVYDGWGDLKVDLNSLIAVVQLESCLVDFFSFCQEGESGLSFFRKLLSCIRAIRGLLDSR